MRVLTLILCASMLAGLSGCVDAIEEAARSAAELAEECGAQSTDHEGNLFLPVPLREDSSFEVPQSVSVLMIEASVNASSPGTGRLEVRDPADDVVFRLEAGVGTTEAQGAKEILTPTPGRYSVHGSGTPEGAFHMEVFVVGCGSTNARTT